MTTAPSYADAYADWMRDPAAYWAAEAEGITWTKPWDTDVRPRHWVRSANGSPAGC